MRYFKKVNKLTSKKSGIFTTFITVDYPYKNIDKYSQEFSNQKIYRVLYFFRNSDKKLGFIGGKIDDSSKPLIEELKREFVEETHLDIDFSKLKPFFTYRYVIHSNNENTWNSIFIPFFVSVKEYEKIKRELTNNIFDSSINDRQELTGVIDVHFCNPLKCTKRCNIQNFLDYPMADTVLEEIIHLMKFMKDIYTIDDIVQIIKNSKFGNNFKNDIEIKKFIETI